MVTRGKPPVSGVFAVHSRHRLALSRLLWYLLFLWPLSPLARFAATAAASPAVTVGRSSSSPATVTSPTAAAVSPGISARSSSSTSPRDLLASDVRRVADRVTGRRSDRGSSSSSCAPSAALSCGCGTSPLSGVRGPPRRGLRRGELVVAWCVSPAGSVPPRYSQGDPSSLGLRRRPCGDAPCPPPAASGAGVARREPAAGVAVAITRPGVPCRDRERERACVLGGDAGDGACPGPTGGGCARRRCAGCSPRGAATARRLPEARRPSPGSSGVAAAAPAPAPAVPPSAPPRTHRWARAAIAPPTAVAPPAAAFLSL